MDTQRDIKDRAWHQVLSQGLRSSQGRRKQSGPFSEPLGAGLLDATKPLVEDEEQPPVNRTMFQSFEWYTKSGSTPTTQVQSRSTSADGQGGPVLASSTHYSLLTSLLPALVSLGITSLWLPPGCKASNPLDNGYGIYDLYDLGEFEWKGSRETKWGSKADLVELGRTAERLGVGLLWDTVLNHRAAADHKERAKAIPVQAKDRSIDMSSARQVETWTSFTYPARNGKYSAMEYNWKHFSGIDWDDLSRSKEIYRFVGDGQTVKPGWADDVDDELGNYDYLMFADVDYSQPEVQADVLNWAIWLPKQVPGLKGMRLDAIKHYSAKFQYRLIKHIRDHAAMNDWFFVGEYWRSDSTFLSKHIDRFAGHMHLFDVKLVYNFSDFSAGRVQDLRRIFQDSLVDLRPGHAVTFVCNHDTQSTQSLAAPVSDWFVLHAYALILLRCGGHPCVFYGDIFGINGPEPRQPSSGGRLVRLLVARNMYAYGRQYDYFDDDATCVGWTREGHAAHSAGAGLAAVVSSSWGWRKKRMFVGIQHAGETWTDLTGSSWDVVDIDTEGWGVFRVGSRSVGVWTSHNAPGRNRVDELIFPSTMGNIAR